MRCPGCSAENHDLDLPEGMEQRCVDCGVVLKFIRTPLTGCLMCRRARFFGEEHAEWCLVLRED